MSFVYFMKPIGLDSPIKIGFSASPAARLIALSAGSPWPLELIGAVPGDAAEEAFLHCCFAEHRSHCEWFFSSPYLRNTIQEIIQSGSVSSVRDRLVPVARPRKTRHTTESERNQRSYAARVRHVVAKLRVNNGWTTTYYAEPESVQTILDDWFKHSRGRGAKPPSAEDINHLEAFISNPIAAGAVRHEISRPRPYLTEAAR